MPFRLRATIRLAISFLPGTTAVVYRAEDAGGNVTVCSFNVVVEDNEFPVFTSFPSNVTLNADPLTCTATHSWAFPTVGDNCPAGEGSAPVLQDFESTTQCYETLFGSFVASNTVNGSSGFRARWFASTAASGFQDYLVTPVIYFSGDGEISFEHRATGFANNERVIIDVLDENDNVLIANYFTKTYTSTNVEQENIPVTFGSGNRKLRFVFVSDAPFISSETADLDNLLIPGTMVTNVLNPSCDASRFLIQRSDGVPLSSGDEFTVGTTTISYEVKDSAGNEITQSFTITVENNIAPPSGQTTYSYCFGATPPTMMVTTGPGQSANWYDNIGNLLASNTDTYTPPASADLVRIFNVEGVNASGCASATRLEITLLQVPLPSTPSAPSPVSYCLNDTPSALSATPDADHVLNWYSVATGGTASATAPTPDTSVVGSTSYWVSQTSNSTGCEGPRAEIVVDVYDFPAAPALTVGTDRLCVGDTPGNLDSYNKLWKSANLV